MKKVMMAITLSLIIILPAVGLENSFFEKGTAVHENSSELFPLPEKFSWRNINGTDFTTPVKNQEPCPSCEAYALVAALETMVQYKAGYPFGCDLSEAHLFFCSGGTCKWGVNVSHAADYMIEHGVPDEGCFPDPHRKTDMPCNMTLPGWENRTVKIKEWGWVENDMDSIKRALIEHGPLVICIFIWEDFMHYREGIYKHRWGMLKGGHLVSLFGYNDEQQCWIVKNSWGENWGEDGWFRMAYDADMLIPRCYGGTGILYIGKPYGNFMPDVPKVHIEEPRRYHTYLFGKEIPSIFGRVLFQVGIPRVFGYTDVDVNVTNAERVEFYVDGEMKYTDDEPPFLWQMDVPIGMHTIEVFAYNEDEKMSKDMVDVFVNA
ncbi:MAG: C1 family peptidase [Candidatus Thermoplasmatota archaeon]|nr:C1 family peptidase [Candidatus Thermoplasmatota archaeon]